MVLPCFVVTRSTWHRNQQSSRKLVHTPDFCEGLCESSALEEPHNLPLGRDITIFSNSEEMTLFQGAEEHSKIDMFPWKS